MVDKRLTSKIIGLYFYAFKSLPFESLGSSDLHLLKTKVKRTFNFPLWDIKKVESIKVKLRNFND